MRRHLAPALATLVLAAAALSIAMLSSDARADDGWFLGAGASNDQGGPSQTSLGLAFERHVVSSLGLVVRGDYDFESTANVYRSAVFGLRLRAPLRAVHPWLEAGVGLGGNASTSAGGMASSVSLGTSVAMPFGFEPFAEARLLHIADTPGADRLTEYRIGGQFKFGPGE